ncbi:MAG: YhdH/YhfP family quinone oxidoreductase [Balneolaceae bacterium]|nr:YhdH/YhfP family quinone oxidoreductase [Balneolaceae bacterium]
MEKDTFTAFVVHQKEDQTFEQTVTQRSFVDLPDYPVLIRVKYSSLNYKDALSASGNKGVTSSYPHTPGIDAAGIVEQSDDERLSAGDPVIVTSYDLGENTSGGFGQYIRVPGDWIVPLPDGLTLRESMIYGTAGFTAAYGVLKIQQNQSESADVPALVTGATGGVGSFAVGLLAQEGYAVTAATGKLNQTDYLRELGARDVIHRKEVTDVASKPLLDGRWSAAVDTVGGEILDAVLRQTKHNGTVTCCGNILGGELSTNIYPFILRGISLMGIDSGRCPMPRRRQIWKQLAGLWKLPFLNRMVREITLDQLKEEIKKILRGDQTGRIILNLNL